MPEAQIPIIKGDKIGSETDYRDALLTNMYAVKRNVLGAQGYILSYPGLTLKGTGSGVDRGANYNERFTDQYRVSGQKLISVDENGTTTELGDIPGELQAAMPYSFNTQCIIANKRMFLYSTASGFSEVTDPDLGDPIDGIWINGYYFLTDGDFLYHTDITDESSIDPLKFATAEFMPDPSLGLAKTQDNKVMVFGRYSLEYFVDKAQENFSFARVETRAQKIGIVATHAKCESGGKWYITGGRKDEDVGVHIVGLGDSQKISSREIDKIISQYTEPELANMRMESRTESNVVFVLVHLPNETLCFNESVATSFGLDSAWSILKTDTSGDNTYRAINGVFDARTAAWIYGDKINTNIGLLDSDVSTHYGSIVEALWHTPFLKLETSSLDQIELETIPGFTTTKDATVAFSITYDGLTYGSEWWELYGLPQKYGQRFIVRRLGYVGDWAGLKFRTASRSRMAFSSLKVTYA